jgi:hypothetical protein
MAIGASMLMMLALMGIKLRRRNDENQI